MSSETESGAPLVVAEGIGKWFPSTLTRTRMLRQLWPAPLRPLPTDFWALRDVSFEMPRGRVLGIIGRNGSGKSTLLQIVAGLMAPSTGRLAVTGSVTPLLELGAGFNPEFTGRENVLLSAEIYGHSPERIRDRIEEISAFAGIGRYMDQPVKTYSSGMFARLAFAVAIETSPDLLIVDEILSVGDVGFQARCFERIERLRDEGAGIFFVSHDLSAVQIICNEVLLLDRGRLVLRDEPRAATDAYLRMVTQPNAKPGDDAAEAPPAGSAVRIEQARFLDAEGAVVPQAARTGQRYTYEYTVVFLRDVARPIFTMQLKTMLGLVVYDQNSLFAGVPIGPQTAGRRKRVRFDFVLHVCPGPFRLGAGVAEQTDDVPRPLAGSGWIAFEAVSDRRAYGLANLEAEMQVCDA